MRFTTLLASQGTLPHRPASPKLGDFSKIFTFLQLPPDRCEGVADDSSTDTAPAVAPPATPRLSLMQLVPYNGGFLDGLKSSSIDLPNLSDSPQDNSILSEDNGRSPRKSTFSGSDSHSTAASSPPQCFEQKGTSSPPSEAQQYDYLLLPLRDGFGGSSGSLSIPADLPTHLLLDAEFYEFAPLHGVDPNCVPPRYLSNKASKIALLETRLSPQYQLDGRLSATSCSAADSPIHIFVDLSNIVIGFYDRLKSNRGIRRDKRVKAPPFFFEAFARILERGRQTARKVVAGSAIDSADRNKWPAYMREAEACGYEMNILSRVTKNTPPKRRPRWGNKPSYGWTTSDHNSSDDALPATSTKQGEQAVDEVLHLKMCHSFLDHDSSTIVLATGDAAVAEFSDGFLKHVERALERGWCVELLSWSKGISSSWRAVRHNPLWAGRFRIIELDEFADELMAVFIDR